MSEDEIRGRILEGTPTEIDARVEGLKRLLEKDSGEEWKSVARRLHRVLLEPVLEDLDGRERLVVIPDGPLVGFPFEALLASEQKTEGLLIERLGISYAPSARVWLERKAEMGRRGREKILSYGYSPPSHETGVDEGRHIRFNLYREVGRPLGPLPGVRKELDLIQQLAPDSLVVANLEATESRFRALDHSSFSLMHFAGHALLGGDLCGSIGFGAGSGERGGLRGWFSSRPRDPTS